MGSVKDLTVLKPASENEFGLGVFTFSDRYSVFDWGEMPDQIPGKGTALALMAAHTFEALAKAGKLTHYVGLMNNFGRIGTIDDAGATNKMVVYLSNVIKPKPIMECDKHIRIIGYDYSEFRQRRGEMNNFLVPLEIVYRNGAPAGSSLFGKIKKAQERGDKAYINSLLQKTGLTSVEQFVPGVRFPKSIYDFSTKLEETGDRALTDEEAFRISGLSETAFEKMLETRDFARETVGKVCKKAGFEDWDGKAEFTYFNVYGPMLCDVLGTFDENRFVFNGEQISKEFLRQWYKKNQPEWHAAVEEAKATGKENWQSACKVQPRHLPKELVELVGRMYTLGAQRYIGRKFFRDDPSLEKTMEQLRPYRE